MKKILIFFIIIFSSPLFGQSKPNYTNFGKPKLFMDYLNTYRKDLGLSELVYDIDVEKAAKIQAIYNYENKKEKNLHENITYPHNKDRLICAGVDTEFKFTGENAYALLNITRDLSDLEKHIFECYKKSTGHNKTMTFPNFTRMGMFTIYDGKNLYSIVVFISGKSVNKKTEADSVVNNFADNQKMLKLLNEYRKSKGLEELTYNTDLERAAKLQAVYNMVNKRDPEQDWHKHPKYSKSYERVKAVNNKTNIEFSGEIIYGIYGIFPDQMKKDHNNQIEKLSFEGLKNSKDHNDHMTHSRYTQVGMYAVYDGEVMYYVIVLGYLKGE